MLHLIRDKIDNVNGPFQSGFKRGRSCADIVWAQRMLVLIVMSKHLDFYKMGIDMSWVFDTIKRSKALEVLHQAGWNLAGTKMKDRVKSIYSADNNWVPTRRESFHSTIHLLPCCCTIVDMEMLYKTQPSSFLSTYATRDGIHR